MQSDICFINNHTCYIVLLFLLLSSLLLFMSHSWALSLSAGSALSQVKCGLAGFAHLWRTLWWTLSHESFFFTMFSIIYKQAIFFSWYLIFNQLLTKKVSFIETLKCYKNRPFLIDLLHNIHDNNFYVRFHKLASMVIIWIGNFNFSESFQKLCIST